MTATMTQPAADQATPYLDAVRAALAGAPSSERDELLDDLAEHLAELTAEDPTPLVERLGPPDAYAAEFVASAGVNLPAPPAAAEPPPPLWDRVRERLDHSPTAASVRAFLPELRPGWWVLRAHLVVAALAAAGDGSMVPIPSVLGSRIFGSALALGAMVVSVKIGRSERRRWNQVLGVGGVIAALIVAAHLDRTEYVYADGSYGGYSPGGALIGPEGRVITNIWPFDGAGQPLEGVLLFDQDGVPISVGADYTNPSSIAIPGLFPQEQYTVEYDPRTGQEQLVPVEPPTVSVPGLPPAQTTTTVAEPTTTIVAETTTTAPPPPG